MIKLTYNYALLNDDNICIGISSLSGKVDKSNMIRLLQYDESLLGQLWNGETFEPAPVVEEEESVNLEKEPLEVVEPEEVIHD